MLDLQKASAGSGKTYTLARKFLEYMLVTGNPPRLRRGKELEDALRHILAVTVVCLRNRGCHGGTPVADAAAYASLTRASRLTAALPDGDGSFPATLSAA